MTYLFTLNTFFILLNYNFKTILTEIKKMAPSPLALPKLVLLHQLFPEIELCLQLYNIVKCILLVDIYTYNLCIV